MKARIRVRRLGAQWVLTLHQLPPPESAAKRKAFALVRRYYPGARCRVLGRVRCEKGDRLHQACLGIVRAVLAAHGDQLPVRCMGCRRPLRKGEQLYCFDCVMASGD